MRARIEQLRQARSIHGGVINMWAAACGVKLSRVPIPSRRMREHVYRTIYGRKYSALREDELERPLAEFRSLNDLFTRGVRPEFRPIPDEDAHLLCPCDGTVQEVGSLQQDTLLTVKGIGYSLQSLLPGVDPRRFENGSYGVFFLSPADCHRVFSPCEGTILELIHVPGRRLLVHPPCQRREFPVFALNERVIIRMDTPLGACLLVLVAGWGVGNITHPFDARLRLSGRRVTHSRLPHSIPVRRGDWLATFELGSTVILISEPHTTMQPRVRRDHKVVYGQTAFSCDRDGESPTRRPAQVRGRQSVRTSLIVDLGEALGKEYAQHLAGAGCPVLHVDRTGSALQMLEHRSLAEFAADPLPPGADFGRVVVFLPPSRSDLAEAVLARCAALVASTRDCHVCLVGSWRAHFDDRRCVEVEELALNCLRSIPGRGVTILRTGQIGPGRNVSLCYQALAPLHPLVSDSFRTCVLDRHELFCTLDGLGESQRVALPTVQTLLGENRQVQDILAERIRPSIVTSVVAMFAHAARLLLLGQMIKWVFRIAARMHPPLRRWQCGTLQPRSTRELLQLYNSFNRPHVAIAGYNTGVTHFGWKYPGRTVVKTVESGHRIRIHGDRVDVDAGVTLKRLVEKLSQAGRELYVTPNYSYISLGTVFMVPVHGSGSDISTLGETIEQVTLYDPEQDRLRIARRGDGQFERHMYNPAAGSLILRLKLRVRPKSRYFMRQSRLESPSADEIWSVFADSDASNIELRKAGAGASVVDVRKFYAMQTPAGDALEIPRDSIGRLWDRLEENPVTSYLFHTFVRKFGFHVELFLTRDEFNAFWQAHGSLPLSKVQLRFMRRDNLPHSPCGDGDRISIDLFLKRMHREAFLTFMRENLPHARFNPGKHSM